MENYRKWVNKRIKGVYDGERVNISLKKEKTKVAYKNRI